MTTTAQIQDTDGNWLFIVPISNLKLTGDVNYEFRVNRVAFISRDRIPRVRKRLGFPVKLSEYKKETFDKFFKMSETYAFLSHSGKPKELKTECLRIIKDEIAILAVSQMGFKKRRFMGSFGIMGEHAFQAISNVFIDTNDKTAIREWQRAETASPLVLNKLWKNYQRQMFFLKLLNILNRKVRVARWWRDDLERAAILLGKSILSNDIPASLMYNMIALEVLLTKQGDKYTEILPERAEAFLGWIGFWEQNNFAERIKEVYKLRSSYVHDGKVENITKKDLLFTDDLLFNIMLNLCNLSSIFYSKRSIVEFSEKVKAEHILGIKSKVRSKKLSFVSRTYTKKDYDEI